MKGVKFTSLGFIAFNLLFRLLFCAGIVLLFESFFAFLIFGFVYLITFVIALLSMISIRRNKRVIALGILNILFVSEVGGVLYLVWNSNKTE